MQWGGQLTDVNNLNGLGDRMKWARGQRKLSQHQLAKAAGVSVGTIGNAEAGLRDKPRELLAIARALGANPEWLERGTGNWEAAEQGPVLLVEELELLMHLRKLPAADREQIAHRVEEIAATYRRYEAARAFRDPEDLGNFPIAPEARTGQSELNSNAATPSGELFTGQDSGRTTNTPSPLEQAAVLPGEDGDESGRKARKVPGKANRRGT